MKWWNQIKFVWKSCISDVVVKCLSLQTRHTRSSKLKTTISTQLNSPPDIFHTSLDHWYYRAPEMRRPSTIIFSLYVHCTTPNSILNTHLLFLGTAGKCAVEGIQSKRILWTSFESTKKLRVLNSSGQHLTSLGNLRNSFHLCRRQKHLLRQILLQA